MRSGGDSVLSPGLASSSERVSPLGLEHGCCDSLSWRCDLATPERDVDPVEAHLVESGYRSKCRDPRLRVLRHRDGHEVVLVTATGRVQFRVDIATPKSDREATADRLYRQLVAGLPPAAAKLAGAEALNGLF